MAADMDCSLSDLMKNEELRKKIDPNRYVGEDVGLPTLNDIISELAKPGRDPREQFEAFKFADGIDSVDKLSAGMKLPGIVTNITAFGVFVDIGVHQDGLVHISQLSNSYVKDPADIVKLQQQVTVTVLEIDKGRDRISLSMKDASKPAPARKSKPKKKVSNAKPLKKGVKLIDQLTFGG
jgi:uncharacterized protein